MLLRLATLCLVLLVCSFLKPAVSQRDCNVPAQTRILCGELGEGRRLCEDNDRCCWDETERRCYISSDALRSSQTMEALRTAERSFRGPPPPSGEETARVFTQTAGNLEQRGLVSGRSIGEVNARIAQRNFLGLLIDFPECAVKTPFCHRSFCNRENPTAESDPLVCLQDPQCCFDKDLFLYKAVFGRNFMGGAPVCYYGPTSSQYRTAAGFIQPWNPFFQPIAIQLFETLFDNTIVNFQIQATCALTNLLGGIVFLQTPKCGWEGITRLQCHLKGCCYNDDTNECNYPSQGNNFFGLPSSSGNREFYPELVPQPYDDLTCDSNRPAAFTPNIFRRLPCRCNVSLDNLQAFVFGCPRGQCCPNFLALFPQVADLSAISGGFSANQLQLNPAFLLSPFLPSIDRTSIASFYCPYFFLPLPGFPDLTGSVLNCCKQQPCYHLKRGSGGGGGGGFPPFQRANWANWGPFGPCTGPPCNGRRTRQRRCLGSGNFPSNACQGTASESESCTTPQCCNWNNWSQYSQCAGPCGGQGRQTRTRQCGCPGGQRNCPGRDQETVPCQPLCPAEWTPWRPVGPCNAPCGQSGVVLRRRQCRRNGAPASGCRGRREERVSCQGPPCPASWTPWALSGPCDARCEESGFQLRRRECRTDSGGFANSCPGSRQDRVPCTGGPCPASWSVWSPYGACNAPCGRNGQQTRTRRCQRRNGAGGSNCPGSNTSRRTCQGPPCPSRWTRWGPYGDCTGPCSGPRVQTRTRRCERPNGTPANNCPGIASQQRNCQDISCYAYTDWSPYTPCMSACTRQRSRYCRDTRTNDPVANSNCGGNTEPVQRNACSGGTCVPPPPEPWVSWAEWIDWTGCSQTCGRGQRTRERLCLYRGRADSPIDNSLCICAYGPNAGASQDQACNNNPCGQSDQYVWTAWTPCSRCTGGNSRRSRRCTRENTSQQVASNLCPGRDTETIPCNPRTNTCIQWSAWSQYTTVCSCPAGTFERVRCRITGSQECVNPEYEYRNCPPGSC